LPPGLKATSLASYPLNEGFIKIFGWERSPLRDTYATALSFPATYATAFGFIFSYGKLLMSMSHSHLLPQVFELVTNIEDSHPVPYAAMILGSLLGYCLCIAVEYSNLVSISVLFNVCILSGFIAYMCQCYGYLALQYKYRNIKREFQSPTGIFGAIWAMLVFFLGSISVVAFQNDGHVAFISLLCIALLLSVYYFKYVQDTQTFSDDERAIMMIAHVINFNKRRNSDKKVTFKVPLVDPEPRIPLKELLSNWMKGWRISPEELSLELNSPRLSVVPGGEVSVIIRGRFQIVPAPEVEVSVAERTPPPRSSPI
jgi:amino acid transporter